MRDRAKRAKARSKAVSRICPRDLEALASVARCGFLTTTQLARLHFTDSVRVAQRRLRCLLDHRLVMASLQSEQLHRPTVFRPTKPGLELLLDGEHNLGERTQISRLPKPAKLRHAIAIRDIAVVAQLLAARGSWTLDRTRFDSDLASEPVLRAAGLIPDLLLEVRVPSGEVSLFVEVDCGTEPLATLVSKVDRYDELRAGAAEYARAEVLFIVEGEKRTVRLRGLVEGRRARVAEASAVTVALGLCSCGQYAPLRRTERTGESLQVVDLTVVRGLRRVGV